MPATPRSPRPAPGPAHASHASPRPGSPDNIVAETLQALLGSAKARAGEADSEERRELAAKCNKVLAGRERRLVEELYNNDGVSPGIYHYLWLATASSSANHSVRIPQTVIFLNGTPIAWFFWSMKEKKVLRKRSITTDNILDVFTGNQGDSPVCATYQQQELLSHDPTAEVQQAPRALSQVQYLSDVELTALLTKGIRQRGVAVLQRFVVPADKRCTTVCTNWSPQNCVVQRRSNRHRLLDSSVEVARKLVTWDGPELLSETVPLSGTVVAKRVEDFCRGLVDHVFAASGGRFGVFRLSATFRTGADSCLYFLGCTSLRLLDAGEQASEMAQAISRAQRGEREPPGPVPTTAVMTSTMRLNGSSRPLSAASRRAGSVLPDSSSSSAERSSSAPGPLGRRPLGWPSRYGRASGSAPPGSLKAAAQQASAAAAAAVPLQQVGGRLYSRDSSALLVTSSPRGMQAASPVGFSAANSPRPDEQFVCVLTGRVCSNREKHEVFFSRLLQHWQSELERMPLEERQVAELQVPPAIMRALPGINVQRYLSVRSSPTWLSRTAAVCEEGAAIINALAARADSRSLLPMGASVTQLAQREPLAAGAASASAALARSRPVSALLPSRSGAASAPAAAAASAPAAAPAASDDALGGSGLIDSRDLEGAGRSRQSRTEPGRRSSSEAAQLIPARASTEVPQVEAEPKHQHSTDQQQDRAQAGEAHAPCCDASRAASPSPAAASEEAPQQQDDAEKDSGGASQAAAPDITADAQPWQDAAHGQQQPRQGEAEQREHLAAQQQQQQEQQQRASPGAADTNAEQQVGAMAQEQQGAARCSAGDEPPAAQEPGAEAASQQEALTPVVGASGPAADQEQQQQQQQQQEVPTVGSCDGIPAGLPEDCAPAQPPASVPPEAACSPLAEAGSSSGPGPIITSSNEALRSSAAQPGVLLPAAPSAVPRQQGRSARVHRPVNLRADVLQVYGVRQHPRTQAHHQSPWAPGSKRAPWRDD